MHKAIQRDNFLIEFFLACASRDIEFFLDHYDLRELTHSKEKAKEKSGICH